ncbi:uncharacterized protein LOC106165090 [Lingula anatina]|uniref:Uncharacterized protein LOC106165090 n=1 Tax=Lingula anatina TaxID=7574 RepID=A0A1S3IKA2_LINAN|nr:uncharacterized protein LOC106165090 [Lingula anatina]|eukprot:XP_013398637.1 uncharacterized protein LOC106165090 [Lingula anatina]
MPGIEYVKTMWREWIFLVFCLPVCTALTITNRAEERYVELREPFTAWCNFTLGPDEGRFFLSVEWFKQTSAEKPPDVIFKYVLGMNSENKTLSDLIGRDINFVTMPSQLIPVPNDIKLRVAIMKSELRDEGNYTCQVSVDGNKVKKSEKLMQVTMTVTPELPMISSRRMSDNRTLLTCISVGGRPPAKLRWFENDQEMSSVKSEHKETCSASSQGEGMCGGYFITDTIAVQDNSSVTYACESRHPTGNYRSDSIRADYMHGGRSGSGNHYVIIANNTPSPPKPGASPLAIVVAILIVISFFIVVGVMVYTVRKRLRSRSFKLDRCRCNDIEAFVNCSARSISDKSSLTVTYIPADGAHSITPDQDHGCDPERDNENNNSIASALYDDREDELL